MAKKDNRNLRIASDEMSSSEIHSIILRGVLYTFKSIFISYYVSENIEAMMNYINEKKIINPKEYKRLLAEAKDFYPVIICALFIPPIKAMTKNYKLKSLDVNKKDQLFNELYKILMDFSAFGCAMWSWTLYCITESVFPIIKNLILTYILKSKTHII